LGCVFVGETDRAQYIARAVPDQFPSELLADTDRVTGRSSELTPNDSTTVERCNQAAQYEARAIECSQRADRDLAATFEAGQESAFRVGRDASDIVVQWPDLRKRFQVVCTDHDRECTLPCSGKPVGRTEQLTGEIIAPESPQPGEGENDTIIAALDELLDT
jgi:hypothetical protein